MWVKIEVIVWLSQFFFLPLQLKLKTLKIGDYE
jgi:hypothetical protein